MIDAIKLRSKMESYKLTATSDSDDGRYPCIKFKSPMFTFMPEQGSKKWLKLVNAINNNESYCIDWSPCNGECNISVKDNMVNFNVAKYGDGCGGYLDVSFPSYLCVDAFKQAYDITNQWLNK